jgi:hypothetical protein
MQKAVVIVYTLINLVNKITTHLLSGNNLDCIMDPLRHNPTNNLTKLIPGFTNHVRVHAVHDREHDCYNSFTLCRGCTRSS